MHPGLARGEQAPHGAVQSQVGAGEGQREGEGPLGIRARESGERTAVDPHRVGKALVDPSDDTDRQRALAASGGLQPVEVERALVAPRVDHAQFDPLEQDALEPKGSDGRADRGCIVRCAGRCARRACGRPRGGTRRGGGGAGVGLLPVAEAIGAPHQPDLQVAGTEVADDQYPAQQRQQVEFEASGAQHREIRAVEAGRIADAQARQLGGRTQRQVEPCIAVDADRPPQGPGD
ncbi:MAG: hypothetical protein ACK559_40540, partial [bacterium]